MVGRGLVSKGKADLSEFLLAFLTVNMIASFTTLPTPNESRSMMEIDIYFHTTLGFKLSG